MKMKKQYIMISRALRRL